MFNWLKRKKQPPVDSDLAYVLACAQYSVSPHKEVPFSAEEQIFFQELVNQFRKAGLNPRKIRLTRMSTMAFDVDAYDVFLGKINLFTEPDRYAVIKSGGKRAYKIFDKREDAERFLSNHPDYSLEIRDGREKWFMQYLVGMYDSKELYSASLDEYVAAIPRWVKYIRYSRHSR